MSLHIAAKPGEIAEKILLPGDPLRAKVIAERYLEDVTMYNTIRNMYGFTGTYRGVRVSVQGTGMGVPSISIYVHELLQSYGVKQLIRVGTCGSMQPHVHVRDLILAIGAATDSAINHQRFGAIDYAPTADFHLLSKAYQHAMKRGLAPHVGNIFTTDTFYTDDTKTVDVLRRYGVLAVEMEAAALYTLAHKFGAQALAVLTVSDHLLTKEETTAEEREQTFYAMMEVALDTLVDEASSILRSE